MIAILVLRRIPPLLVLYKFIPEIASWREALFSGHFGPMGVSAVFVSALAITRLPTPEHPPADQAQYLAATLQPIVSFVVLGSIIVHGLSIPFFTIGRGVHSRTTSLTVTWTNRTRTTVPDWVMWARRVDKPADIVGTMTGGDVERGTSTPSNTFRDPDETAMDIPETTEHGPPATTVTVTAVGDVSADAMSVVTERRFGGKNADIVEVDVVSDLLREPADDSGTSSDNQFKVVRFPSAQ